MLLAQVANGVTSQKRPKELYGYFYDIISLLSLRSLTFGLYSFYLFCAFNLSAIARVLTTRLGGSVIDSLGTRLDKPCCSYMCACANQHTGLL